MSETENSQKQCRSPFLFYHLIAALLKLSYTSCPLSRLFSTKALLVIITPKDSPASTVIETVV
ncbi:hypothetical protein MUO98_01690 [Candidatus Bathyarchaeota archaeon]|nr:hypothetical protein [Candidatus Bathyarchaeota archaeon]